jgi:cyclopropane fatty-acyl-phospholipid synthase-like methyltransferase
LSRNQAKYGNDWAAKEGVSENCRLLCRDYREIPKGQKFDRITALEMAEHVGVLRFNTFLTQIKDLMHDDSLFFMQVAGLRRTWKYEDLIWGLFMARQIFPGADASTPQNWYMEQLERAGFEVQSAETLGTHYSATIWRWYVLTVEKWLTVQQVSKLDDEPQVFGRKVHGKAIENLGHFPCVVHHHFQTRQCNGLPICLSQELEFL